MGGMNKCFIPFAAVLACLASAGPSFATDDPPPASPPAGTNPPVSSPAPETAPAPQPAPVAGCQDVTRPRTRITTSPRTAVRRHVVRGIATDKGCASGFVARVQISISHKSGKRCRFVTASARLSKKRSSCTKPHWLTAAGTATWSKRLPKKLAHGTYRVLTRAVDSAGNVERAHARLFRITSK